MLTHWKESYDQHSIFKSRDITLSTKVHLVKAMVLPVVMYGCESWTVKKAEHWRMAGWHHWLDGPGSEWTPGVGAGQGGLAYCYSWGRKQSDTTERLNWTEWRVVITFVPRSRILLISWLKSPSAVLLEPPKIVCQWFHCFPIYFLGNDGTRCHDLSFLNVEL